MKLEKGPQKGERCQETRLQWDPCGKKCYWWWKSTAQKRDEVWMKISKNKICLKYHNEYKCFVCWLTMLLQAKEFWQNKQINKTKHTNPKPKPTRTSIPQRMKQRTNLIILQRLRNRWYKLSVEGGMDVEWKQEE